MTIFIGKLATKLTKLMGNRGTNVAGSIAVKLNKNIFNKLASNIETIILVTGTNGKTTTSNIIASVIEGENVFYLHNKEGANMYTGILSTMINNYKYGSKEKIKYAIFEVDEGSIPRVVNSIDNGYLVINNFFRDQLDRYSEIDMLIEKIKSSVTDKNLQLIINSDDPFCNRFDNEKMIGFGLNNKIDIFEKGSVTDSKFCPKCGKALKYTHTFYGQLGHFSCSCGFKRLKPTYLVSNIKPQELTVNKINYKHNMVGSYNAYNVLAAISLLKELNFNDSKINNGLSKYFSDDGRMQLFNINNNNIYLNLVKNPAGMNMTLQESKHLNIKNICFILNDLHADGRDVSWIWDSDYENTLELNIKNYYACGIRANDMAIRLKNMGVAKNKIVICENIEDIVEDITKEDSLIVSSYTALNKTKIMLEKKRS